MNEKEWYRIINTYFTGYCTKKKILTRRKNERALYLANQEYNKIWSSDNKTNQWQNWYMKKYKIGVIAARGDNIIPCLKFGSQIMK